MNVSAFIQCAATGMDCDRNCPADRLVCKRKEQLDWGCDCEATPAQRHLETCSVTPIYGSVIASIGLPDWPLSFLFCAPNPLLNRKYTETSAYEMARKQTH